MPWIRSLLCSSTLFSLVILTGCSDSGPAATVERFYRAVEAGEVKTASEFVSGSIVAMMGREKIEAALEDQTADISRKGGIQSLEVLSEQVDGIVAVVHVRITYGNGETYEENMDLTRIDGRWMLTPDPKEK